MVQAKKEKFLQMVNLKMNELWKKVAELNEKGREEELANLYKNLFSTPEGELVLEDIKMKGYFYAPTPLGEHGQRCEGMRQVILSIFSQLNYEKPPPEDNMESEE